MSASPSPATATPCAAATHATASTWRAPAAVLDPHRRKVSHASFFGAVGGVSTLTASGTLCALREQDTTPGATTSKTPAHVFVLCGGDVIAPFLAAGGREFGSLELVHGASIDVLVEGAPTMPANPDSHWWSCSLHAITELTDVDAAVAVLTQNTSDWELGWTKPLFPPPLVSHAPTDDGSSVTVQSFSGAAMQAQSSFQYPNGRRRSAGLVAVLKVQRLSSEVEAEKLATRPVRPSTPPPVPVASPTAPSAWPANYPSIAPSSFPPFHLHPWLPVTSSPSRGSGLTVYSSPYGLLSPHIFHNTMTRGIVSNCVTLDERERQGGHRGHFGSTERASASSLAGVPPALLLLDARCFSGSEGAPVLLTTQTPQACTPIAAMITLPIRHTARGSAVELNLAIPIHRIQSFLRSKQLHVWTPPQSDAPTPAPAVQGGRGEGWRIVQNARRSITPISASASTQRWSLLSMQDTAHSRTRSTHAPLPPAKSPVAFSLSPLSSSAVAAATPPRRILPSSAATLAVERAERSVLMARIGGSWASAIVLTADGYLLTNAHLVRPFLEVPPSTPDSSVFTPETPDSAPAAPLPLLFDDAIRLKSHVRLSARIESAHLQSDGTDTLVDVGWVDAHLVYVSQGPWDVALLKVSCALPLFPIAFHPAFRHVSPDTTTPQCLPTVGSNALVIGHALFSPSSGLRPTVTAGNLSKIVHLPHSSPSLPAFPALLMTSAAVHNGNSGGLLIDEHTGYFTGMVTSNVMHTPVAPNHRPPVHVRKGPDSYANEDRQTELQHAYDTAVAQAEDARQAQIVHMIIPHLNFSIPYTALLPLLDFVEGGAQDVSLLQVLESGPELVQRLWQLTDLHPEPLATPPFPPAFLALVEGDAVKQPREERS